MKLTITRLALAALALPLVACSTVGYGDPNQVETVNIDYGLSDLQKLAGGMADSLIQAPQLSYYQGRDSNDPRIVVYLGGVENRTTEHIDTEGITNSIQSEIFNSGKFRVCLLYTSDAADE